MIMINSRFYFSLIIELVTDYRRCFGLKGS